MNNRFETFLSCLRATNASLDFFSDFPKIKQRVESIAISLTMLNYLIGKKNLRADVKALWERDSTVF